MNIIKRYALLMATLTTFTVLLYSESSLFRLSITNTTETPLEVRLTRYKPVKHATEKKYVIKSGATDTLSIEPTVGIWEITFRSTDPKVTQEKSLETFSLLNRYGNKIAVALQTLRNPSSKQNETFLALKKI